MNVFTMKKLCDGNFLKSILLVLLLSMVGMTNAQRSFIVGDLEYGIIDNSDNVIVWHHKDGTMATGTLTIPETIKFETHTYTVTKIGGGAFDGCHGLIGDLVIPNTVTTIYDKAFRDCDGFSATLTLGNSVEYIGDQCFENCSGIVLINIPNTITDIGWRAFYNTGWLNGQPDGIVYQDAVCIGYKGEKPTGDLQIAEGTRLIANDAFDGCQSLTSLELPSSLGYINFWAFLDCTGLTSIRSLAVAPPILSCAVGGCAFEGVDMSIPVMVPMGSLHAYQTDEIWSRFTNLMEEGGTSITEIQLGGFTAPTWGAHPDYDLTVPEDAPYAISEVEWSKYNGDVTPQSVFDDEDDSYYMTVILTPAESYVFDPDATVYFNGDATVCDAEYNLVMSNGDFRIFTIDYQVTAPAPGTYVLTVSCNPAQGSVLGSGTYAAGTEVTVAAIPATGFVFDRWNDGVTDNPRTVTLNGNMTLEAFFKTTGVDENGLIALSVYPNPAKESLRIEGLESNAIVEIYNSLGERVKTVTFDEEIHVGDLSQGIYMLRCGKQTVRFVKTK